MTGHNGGALPPSTGGGGDGRSDRDSGDSLPNYGQRLRRARLGLAVAMTPILMLFVSFTVAYLIRRGFVTFEPDTNSYARTWLPVQLPWRLLFANTVVLAISSITMELARRAITRQAALDPVKSIPGVSLGSEREFPWLSLTTFLGLLFLAGQLYVWTRLAAHGFYIDTGASSSFVYLLSGMHGLHLTGGVLVLLFANIAAWRGRPIQTRRIIVDVTTWYWHAMTGIWLYILVLFSFATR